jgi:hypothetical protein
VHAALFQKHRLSKGETGYVVILASTNDQAKTVFGYCQGFIEASAALQREVVSITAHEIRLRNNVVIAVHPNSFRSIRGRTLLCCVFDEISFWRDESSANPDQEVYRAVMPSLLASGGLLCAISTPYRRSGLLYTKHRDFFGKDGDCLVVQGNASTFNPTLSAKLIEAHREADPEGAIAEWDGLFRSDVSAFLSEDLIELSIDRSRPPEIAPQAGVKYACFIDASGGRHDSYTICIGHKDSAGRFICDVLRGTEPPLDPQLTTRSYADRAREYFCTKIVGDGYSADWVVSAFRDCDGMVYERSEKNRSDLYLEGLPAFSRGLVSLPEHRKLGRELRLLERHVSRAGRDRVDHGRGGSDDYANAVFGCLHLALTGSKYKYPSDMNWVYPAGPEASAAAATDYQRMRLQSHLHRRW